MSDPHSRLRQFEIDFVARVFDLLEQEGPFHVIFTQDVLIKFHCRGSDFATFLVSQGTTKEEICHWFGEMSDSSRVLCETEHTHLSFEPSPKAVRALRAAIVLDGDLYRYCRLQSQSLDNGGYRSISEASTTQIGGPT